MARNWRRPRTAAKTMNAYFVVGDASTARRMLAGRRMLMSYAMTLGAKPWLRGPAVGDLAAMSSGFVLDSGAFSVWRSGAAVDMGAYVDWIAAAGAKADFAIALDVIGDAEASVRNWRAMLGMGIRCPLAPVYHEGDPIAHLAEYTSVGGVVCVGRIEGRRSRERTLAFYDECFNACPDAKLHALGISSSEVLERYPFASFDSCSWQRNSAYSNALPWPYSRCGKDTRMTAHIEACEATRHIPPKQLRLVFGEAAQ